MPLKYGSTGASPSGGVVVFVHSYSRPGKDLWRAAGVVERRPQYRGDRPRRKVDGFGGTPGTAPSTADQAPCLVPDRIPAMCPMSAAVPLTRRDLGGGTWT